METLTPGRSGRHPSQPRNGYRPDLRSRSGQCRPRRVATGHAYHFRLVATSTAGTTYSADATFATTGAAPAPAMTPTTGGGATSSGTTSAGAGSEQSGAPRGGAARARVAEVDAVTVRRGGRIVVKVSCPGRAGQYCGLRFTLTVAERGRSDGRTERREPNAAIVGTTKAQISPGTPKPSLSSRDRSCATS